MLKISGSSLAVLILLSAIESSIGCTPRLNVIANPTACDPGIRYYRPKPYLKVEPAIVEVSSSDKTKTNLGLVKISLVYLPDFSEEYALDVRTGFGTANVEIELNDGWNLTKVSQDLDSQTDENLQAVAALLKNSAGLKTTPPEVDSFQVTATDVPIGYYESVIGKRPDGKKQLYGFRYVGFMPYQTCPVSMDGGESMNCQGACGCIYGLTFEGSTMIFKPLMDMAMESHAQ